MTKDEVAPEIGKEEISLLVQHYEASFSITQGRERIRDRLSWWIVSLSIVLTLVVFTDIVAISEPPDGGWLWVVYSLRGDRLEFVIWILMLVTALRHVQVASRIEADYGYLHGLEEHIDGKLSWTFCRERAGYTEKFSLPIPRKRYSVLYKLLVPLFVVAQTSAAVLSGWIDMPLSSFPISFSETVLVVASAVWVITTYVFLRPLSSV